MLQCIGRLDEWKYQIFQRESIKWDLEVLTSKGLLIKRIGRGDYEMKRIIIMIVMGFLLVSICAYSQDSLSGEALKELGLIEGDGTGLNESGDITREAMVKMVVSLTQDLNEDFTLPSQATFKDVPTDHWAFPWVERAYASDLTKGIGSGLFGLGHKVTKQEVAAFMMNTLKESYDYDQVEEIAQEKRGISTDLVGNFNRGNAFEMVAQTLLEIPVGKEKPLFVLTSNFDNKDFNEIMGQVKIKRETSKMNHYTSTWPKDQETYVEWLGDMEEILEPYWIEIDYKTYIKHGFSQESFQALEENPLYIYSRPYADRFDIDYRGYGEPMDISVEKQTLDNVQYFYAEAYNSVKIKGDYQGKPYYLILIKESNIDAYKGFFKTPKGLFVKRMSSRQPAIGLAYQMETELFEKYLSSDSKVVKFNKDHPIFKKELPLDIVNTKIIPTAGHNIVVWSGLDQYLLKMSDIDWSEDPKDNILGHITLSSDDINLTYPIRFFTKSMNEEIYRIYLEVENNNYLTILFSVDAHSEINQVYYQNIDQSGAYKK